MIRRLLCRVLGHDWPDPREVGEYVYATACRRCHARVEGNWEVVEAAGAWRHYR